MKELLAGLRLEVRTGNVTTVRHEWRDPYFHADPYSRLYLVSRGHCQIMLGERSLALRAGHIYLLPSGSPLKLLPPQNLFEHYWVHFTVSVMGGGPLFDFIECPFELPLDRFDRPLRQMTRLVYLARKTEDLDPGIMLEANGLLGVMLSPFISAASRRFGVSERESADFGRFERVLQYIESHLDQSISLADLADIVNLHPTYFSNLFRERFGVAPRQYICRRRITRAQQQLINTAMTIKEIASDIGYDDEFYFSRIFTKYTGIPPTLYRNQKRLQNF